MVRICYDINLHKLTMLWFTRLIGDGVDVLVKEVHPESLSDQLDIPVHLLFVILVRS
jgi:hypothetical protein